MLAVCKHILGSAIPVFQRYLGEVDQTDYSPLKVGKSYSVFSILMIKDRVDYLVCPPGGLPMWAPGQLFEVIDKRLPNGWMICEASETADYAALSQAFGIGCILGYTDLVQNYQHYIGLLERDVEALRIFNREKEAMERQFNEDGVAE